jgi:hypothetical protein
MTSKAQSDTLRFLYQSSATISTNLEGVHAYPTPPAGFDPLPRRTKNWPLMAFLSGRTRHKTPTATGTGRG